MAEKATPSPLSQESSVTYAYSYLFPFPTKERGTAWVKLGCWRMPEVTPWKEGETGSQYPTSAGTVHDKHCHHIRGWTKVWIWHSGSCSRVMSYREDSMKVKDDPILGAQSPSVHLLAL